MTLAKTRSLGILEPTARRETDEIGRVGPAPKLRKPRRIRLVDDVVEALEDAILAGRIGAGERLVEAWISDELEVSRTTVREAFLKLERSGLVVSKSRQGTFVTRVSSEESEDLRATRALLEAYALGTGFTAIDGAVMKRLEDYVDEMRTCVLPDDVPRLVTLDIAFHGLLISGGTSPLVNEIWASLNGRMSVLFLSAIEFRHTGIDDVAAFHQELLDAVRSGNLDRARETVVTHYMTTSETSASGAIARNIISVANLAAASLTFTDVRVASGRPDAYASQDSRASKKAAGPKQEGNH